MKDIIEKIGNFQFDILELPSRGVFYNTQRSFFYVKYLTAKEENILSTPGLSDTNYVLDMVLSSVLLEDIDIDEILVVDRKALILFLRSTSFGDSFELDMSCPNCGTKTTKTFRFSEIEMSDVVVNEKKDFTINFALKDNDDVYKIDFKPLKYSEEKDLKNKDKKSFITNEVIAKIISINNDFDRNMIQKFVLSLPIKKFKELSKNIDKNLPSIIEELKYDCEICGHNESFPFEINDSLLKLEPKYRINFEEEIFLIQYYGKGGFDKEALYDTSIINRRKTLERINNEIEKKNKAEESAVASAKTKKR